MSNKLKLQIAAGSLAFVIWTISAYVDSSLRAAYVAFVISVVTGISTIILRDMPTEQKPADQPSAIDSPTKELLP